MIADMVKELGHCVAAEAGNFEAGCDLAENGDFDLALLDVNVEGAGSRSCSPRLRHDGATGSVPRKAGLQQTVPNRATQRRHRRDRRPVKMDRC
jgi:hypothetical protein